MGSLLRHYFFRLRSSYWFMPTVMAVGAILLSILGVMVDTKIGSSWIDDFSWLYANKPEGARALLSTIAGSMITVAGVTFSITIVSVTAAAGRYGPRILTNFMSDRGNQVTLGVFIATFIYCLMILRVVRGPNEQGITLLLPENDPTGAFVPHISILVAILMAIASIGVLIYFIHHVTESIHISNVTARIARELDRELDREIREGREGRGRPKPEGAERLEQQVREQETGIGLNRTGYVEQIDVEKICAIARQHDVTILLRRLPGEFAGHGVDVMQAWPPARLPGEAVDGLRNCYRLSPQRTSAQDLLFGIDELIEIAVIALSPGVNDPYTALTALEWLGSILTHALELPPPDRYRYDDSGTLRLIIPRLEWIDLFNHVFDRLAPHIVTEPTVTRRAIELLADLSAHAPTPEARRHIEDRETELRIEN